MGSSNLKWVNGSTHRAQDVSNDAVDKYKTIVQQLYLDKNMTREEVLNHLKEGHGFSLSTNQFSKATKRWGFYKQPRHGRAANPPPQSIMKEYDAYNPFDPQEELLKMEPDALDTIDEIEACSQTGSEIVTISLILEDFEGQLPFTAMDLDSLWEAVRNLPQNFLRPHEQLANARKRRNDKHDVKKSRVDYLTCCYLFTEAVYCLESPDKALDKQYRVPRSNTDSLFEQYRRDKDKLLASPDISLDMWSLLCLLEQNSISDDLVDRLDINDLQFTTAVRECLALCEKWIELAGKGLPKGPLQFDSLLLHQTAGKTINNICRPLHEQTRFDVWQEAGYLFAFLWGHEHLVATKFPSWLREAEIAGLSPTHFLAIICRMIVHMTAVSSPSPWMISCERHDTAESICGDYLQTIEKVKRIVRSSTRALLKVFISYFLTHHKGHDIEPDKTRNLESVQSYQRTVEDFVFGKGRDDQEFLHTILLREDVPRINLDSLASSRWISSDPYSSSYIYTHKQYLTLRSANPTMTRSLASGSSRGSSLNSLRAFRAASRAMARRLKEDQDE